VYSVHAEMLCCCGHSICSCYFIICLSVAGFIVSEFSCTATACNYVEFLPPPSLTVIVGDSMPRDPCDTTDCADALQCRQKSSEAGAGEVGTTLTEEPVPPLPPAPCTDSDTTSLLSTSSDSKCIQDSDGASQTVELVAVPDTHSPSNVRKLSTSTRERPPADTVDKPLRQIRPVDDTAQKSCES